MYLCARKNIAKMVKNVLCAATALFLSVETFAVSYTYLPEYGLQVSWQTDDRVGITTGNISNGTMEQLSFWTSSSASSPNDRSLYTVGYLLKPNTAYYSYSPYKWAETFNAGNIKCTYNQQTQTGNDNTSALAKCDYQMAKATTSSSACSFAYKHIGAILRISFLAPADMQIAALNLKTESPTLATAATMDIISQTVTPEDFAATMTLHTENISVAKGAEVVLYMACPPQDLSATSLSITATDGNGNETLLATTYGPNIKSGYLYDFALNKQHRSLSFSKKQQTAESAPLRASGIANPTAHIEDFPIDSDYACSITAVNTDSKPNLNTNNENLKNHYYTLDGTQTTNPQKGNVYFHKGKKIFY